MPTEKQPEAWLRGPVLNISAMLQPVAHALIQSKEELQRYVQDFPEEMLWEKPAGRASVAFHLQHITGVIDRMLTYAKNEKLSDAQFAYLKKEGVKNDSVKLQELMNLVNLKIDEALEKLKIIPDKILTERRGVGRKQLPSTVIGLLFHAGEHTQRHIGQMLVTISILKEFPKKEVL